LTLELPKSHPSLERVVESLKPPGVYGAADGPWSAVNIAENTDEDGREIPSFRQAGRDALGPSGEVLRSLDREQVFEVRQAQGRS
jgi:hypothetical protein